MTVQAPRSPLGERLAQYRLRLRGWRMRVTRFGLVVRLGVLLSGFAAVAVALPGPAGLVAGVVVAPLSMARPRGWFTSLVEVGSVAAWILANLFTDNPSIVGASLLGLCLYVHHSSAAIAASWRADAAVDGKLIRAWLARLGAVLGGAVVVDAVAAGVSRQRLPVPPTILVVVGIIGALGIACGIVYLLAHRDPSVEEEAETP